MPPRRPDVVVVGGGVMGLSIALHLARRGVRPLVLERRFLGAGSSGKSGAIIRQHYSVELTATMARDSLRVFAGWGEAVGGSAGFTQTGMVMIVGAGDSEGLRRNLALQQQLGIRTEELDTDRLREALPAGRVDDDVAGCFEPDAGFADPRQTLHSLAAAVRRAGGEIQEGVEVIGFTGRASRVDGVETNDASIGADGVVVAAGPWADRVMRRAGWRASIQPKRVQCAVLRRPGDYEGGPVLVDFPNEFYAKHTYDTHVGSIAPEETQTVDPDTYDETADASYVTMAQERATRRLPPLGRAQRFGGYGALYAVTPDWHPVVGPAGPEGLYLCAGFSGHGFKLSPSIGETVAAELTNDDPPYDFTPLCPERFEAGDHVTGTYAYAILG